jgi:membrane protease YdiL (CAAX protease family)
VAFGGLFFLAAVILWRLMPNFFWQDRGVERNPFPQARGPADYAMMVVKFGLSALSEEIVTRAYLITRLTDLLRSRAEAVLASAILFAGYHAYQGPPGVGYALAFGLVYGTAFLAVGRVWPLALGHCLYNTWVELLVG